MSLFQISDNASIASILVEDSAWPGVKRIANTFANDLFSVTDRSPVVCSLLDAVTTDRVILIATLDKSAMVKELELAGFLDTSLLQGKRECYLHKLLKMPFGKEHSVKEVLLILGSDKRGTIYGTFHISERCGVSPLCFFGDVAPVKQASLSLDFSTDYVSKEPSVRYRGFFINDEWPAFGNWATERYGDVNAKAYEPIFEMLLRLKGNYFWPAMWNSSFWEEGPGIGNAVLADELGVVMGTSHHEPLIRAGVEWQRQYQQYGDDNTWSFISNTKAISDFWRDGVRRGKDFENVITIGMRGESDSLLLGEDATLQDNINVVKNAISAQNQILREEIGEDLKKVPRMLAIYKEVEDFYFGAKDCVGLREFEEIDDVILLLSDDNHGNLRSIPQPEDPVHPGGYGMYYHFDYHGGPYSYEWVIGTNLTKVWEQMTMAYEHDIREMWIVNVGDVKSNEFALSYFLSLAYDYEKWGISNRTSANEYIRQWINTTFCLCTETQKEQLYELILSYNRLTTMRIPESLNPEVYKNNYYEISRMKKAVMHTKELAEELLSTIPSVHQSGFASIFYYDVMASMNIIKLNLDAAMNYTLAHRGVLKANDYLPLIEEGVEKDFEYVDAFHHFLNGKWNHMMASGHTGFRTWDANDWTYPQGRKVYPMHSPKIVISFRGKNERNLGFHWQDKAPICNTEMMRPDVNEVIFDIDSRSRLDFHYEINCDAHWLTLSKTSGDSDLAKESRVSITLTCDRSKLTACSTAHLSLTFTYANGETLTAFADVKAGTPLSFAPSGAFIEANDYICMYADHYQENHAVNGNGFEVIDGLGRSTASIKPFPVTKNWENDIEKPFVTYQFQALFAGDYTMSFYMTPRNPMVKGTPIHACYQLNDEKPVTIDTIPADFYAGSHPVWDDGAINKERQVKQTVCLKEGLNTLRFYATDPTALLEAIVLSKVTCPIAETHLVPPESYRLP